MSPALRPDSQAARYRRNDIMRDRIERRVELPTTLEIAWQALTDPDWLALWLADETRSGWVEEMSPPDEQGTGRLAFWWTLDDEPASRVELTVTAVADRCTLL